MEPYLSTDTKRRCENCRYALPTPIEEKAMECRVNAPHPVVAQARNLTGQTVPIVLGTFPLVDKGKWCGHFELANDHETRFKSPEGLSLVQ